MKRFAATVPVLLVVLLVFASAAATQPAPRVTRVGMLCNPSCNVSPNDAFLDELREALPQAKRLAVFINPSNEIHRLLFPETSAGAAKLGFQLDLFEVREAGEMPSAIAAAKARGAEALHIFSDPIFIYPPNRVPDLAAQAGLPSISLLRSFAQGGGLISYGPDFPALARRGAHYVDRILKGAKPADLPIEQPTKFLLVMNLKTAKSLGIEIPASLLARADEVIE
jgi:putative ABC transport system substrate-binding protein